VVFAASTLFPTSISDIAGGSYSPVAQVGVATPHGVGLYYSFALYGAPFSGGVNNKFTVNLGGTGNASISAHCISGIAASSALDIVAGGSGSGTSYINEGTPRVGLNEILLNVFTDDDINGETWSAADWTQVGSPLSGGSGIIPFQVQYLIQASTTVGAYAATVTKSSTGSNYIGAMLSFSATPLSTLTPPFYNRRNVLYMS
jgi:hypothetical protein